MKKENFILPKTLQLCLDDVGWMYGRDERDWGGPARTGFPRYHAVEDYMMIEELGNALNMKVTCMFVIGEWDRKGILANVPNATSAGKNWKGSKYYSEERAKQMFNYIQKCSHIEFGVHGLMHDIWSEDGKYWGGGEFFLPKDGKRETPADQLDLGSDEHLKKHFDAFFEIYNDWGFKVPIIHFASPCGGRDALVEGRMTKMLASYGIRFWHNHFWVNEKGEKISTANTMVQNGVICHEKGFVVCPWEGYDIDPDMLADIKYEEAGILSAHWPNILRYNPKKNLDNLGAWVRYFRRQAERFGLMLSRGTEFAHYQQLYANMAKVEEQGDALVIDLTEADAAFPFGERPPVYVSIKKDAGNVEFIGAEAVVYEEKKDFINYELKRTDSAIITIK